MQTLNDYLDDALGALLAARVAAGFDHQPPAPSAAIDEALGLDPACQDARRAFRDAVESGSVMKVEAAHHQAVIAAAEAGWLLAVSTVGKAAC